MKRIAILLSLPLLLAFDYEVIQGEISKGSTDASGKVTYNVSGSTIIKWLDATLPDDETICFSLAKKKTKLAIKTSKKEKAVINGKIFCKGNFSLISRAGIDVTSTGEIHASSITLSTVDLFDPRFIYKTGLKNLMFPKTISELSNEGLLESTEGDIKLVSFRVENKGKVIVPKGRSYFGTSLINQTQSEQRY